MSRPTPVTYEQPQPPHTTLLQILVRAVISLVYAIAVGVLHLNQGLFCHDKVSSGKFFEFFNF